MPDIRLIASSGMDAAVKRLGAAASNIANAGTPAYKPLGTVQQAEPLTGGVRSGYALVGERVDLMVEAVASRQALASYQANAAVLRTADEMQRELLRDFRV